MQPRDHGPSSSRSKQQENPRPPHSHPGPHTLSSKRSVEDYFSSSRFLSTAPGPSSKRPLQKSKTLGASAARRSPTQQKSAGHFQRAGKNLEYNARHSTNGVCYLVHSIAMFIVIRYRHVPVGQGWTNWPRQPWKGVPWVQCNHRGAYGSQASRSSLDCWWP